jgi:hypothetical protein
VVKTFKAYIFYFSKKGNDVIVPIADIQVPDDVFLRYAEKVQQPQVDDRIDSRNVKRDIEVSTGVI